jgi:hypothetical protein
MEDAGNEPDATQFAEMHRRDHKRKGSMRRFKVYPLTLSRRFLDSVNDGE